MSDPPMPLNHIKKFKILSIMSYSKCIIQSVRKEIMNPLEILSKSFDKYFRVGELETSEE